MLSLLWLLLCIRQVEHPVTEMITGTDLVEWQLRVASGQPLPLTQEQIFAQIKGCAVEARIYAENPVADFLPCIGDLVHMRTPTDDSANSHPFKEPGIRVDSGVKSGGAVSMFYDPMIAKLIAYGDDRASALKKLERGLRAFQVAGLPNNIDFLVRCVQHPGFAKGQPTTAFFEEHMSGILDQLNTSMLTESCSKEDGKQHTKVSRHAAFAVAALIENAVAQTVGPADRSQLWSSRSGDWRTFGHVKRQFALQEPSHIVANSAVAKVGPLSVETVGHNHFAVSMEGAHPVQLKILHVARSDASAALDLVLDIDGHTCKGVVTRYANASKHNVVDVWIEDCTDVTSTHAQFVIPHVDHAAKASSSSGKPVVISPMPGKVVKLAVQDGQTVKAGDVVVILEAMKMEHVITAPSDGYVF
jgi:3-methylcrotonyl-CoA carboxylase alpha subunit